MHSHHFSRPLNDLIASRPRVIDFATPAISANQPTAKSFGWIEDGLLLLENASLKIKLDTGTLTSLIAKL